MSYDFSAAVDAAKQVLERNGGNSERKDYKYPLVYPQKGSTIVIRPLFNPASGQIVRLVNRHERIACYKTYNQECPICKMQQNIQDLTGQDPFGRKSSSKARGICYAQYISSTNVISKGENKGNLVPGEIILFMFPWTVYQAINEQIQAIAQSPTGMDQAFSHPQSGLYLQIKCDDDFRYSATTMPYVSYPLKNPDGTDMNDDQFIAFLDGMDSLAEEVLPSTITEEVAKQVQEYADELYAQYIAPQTPSVGVPQGTAPVQVGQVPTAQDLTPPDVTANIPVDVQPAVNNIVPEAVPSAPVVNDVPQSSVGSPVPPVQTVNTVAPTPVPASSETSNNRPQCFGQYNPTNPQCICCPEDLVCSEKTMGGK